MTHRNAQRRFTANTTQAGFSLLEMLVAFVIMAFSLTMIYRVSGGTARNSAELEQYQHASLLADSLLNERDAVPAAGWNAQGTSAGYQWTVRSVPFSTSFAGAAVPPLKEIAIEVRWMESGRIKTYELHTLRPQARPVAGEGLR